MKTETHFSLSEPCDVQSIPLVTHKKRNCHSSTMCVVQWSTCRICWPIDVDQVIDECGPISFHRAPKMTSYARKSCGWLGDLRPPGSFGPTAEMFLDYPIEFLRYFNLTWRDWRVNQLFFKSNNKQIVHFATKGECRQLETFRSIDKAAHSL